MPHPRVLPDAVGSILISGKQGVVMASIDSGSEEDRDETNPAEQIRVLIALSRLDLEAAAAYDVVAEVVESPEVRETLLRFKDEHVRHGADLQRLLHSRGGTEAAQSGRNFGSLLRAAVEIARPLGVEFAIVTLIANEHLTTASYEAVLEYEWAPEELALLESNFADERTHLEWLLDLETTLMMADAEAGAAAGSEEQPPAPA